MEKIANTRKPVILSTGASTNAEVNNAIKILKKGTNKIIILQCILNYPTKNSDANLNMIKSLQREFPDCISGYSDHTMASNYMQNLITAYLLGAKVIEKHFTLNKKKERKRSLSFTQ